jgi:ABC-type dipeptide/oligopeptide/nickel transport system permease subunit
MVVLMLAVSLVSPLLFLPDPTQQALSLRRQGPSLAHPFGNDELGRDMLSRVVNGGRTTIPAGIAAVLVAAVPGTLLGILAGFRRGWADVLITRGADVMLAFPYFVEAIILVAILGRGLPQAVVGIGVANLPGFVRIARSLALTTSREVYVEAAAVVGCSGGRVLFRHILPNTLGPVLAAAATTFGASVLGIAGLGFLGLGAQPPEPEWGTMLGAGRSYVTDAPHIAAIPGVAIALLVLCVNLASDGLRDTLEHKL